MKNYKGMLLIMFLLSVVCIMGQKQEVYAAQSGYVKLKAPGINKSKVYKKYDVTGDGVADKIKMSITSGDEAKYDYSVTAKIMVNDVLVLEHTTTDVLILKVGLVYLKNGKAYLDISIEGINDYIESHKLYEYKNNTFKPVFDFQENEGRYASHYNVTIYKVVGNSIYTKVWGQFFTTGGLSYKSKFKYSKGKIKAVSDEHPIEYKETRKNKWTANKKIKVYKKPGGKKLAYTLRMNDEVRINKVIFKNNKLYFEVMNENLEYGYIPAAKTYPKRIYFKEVQYAG